MGIASKIARKLTKKKPTQKDVRFKKKYEVQEGAGLDPEGGGSVAAARAVGTKGEKVTRGKLSMANFERDQRKYSNFDAKKLLKLYKNDRPAYNRAIKRLEEAESRRVRKAAIGRRDASQKRKADATPDKLTPQQEIAQLRDLNARARVANTARSLKRIEETIEKLSSAGVITNTIIRPGTTAKGMLKDIKTLVQKKQNDLIKAMEKDDLEIGKMEGESQIGRRKKTQSPREFKSRAEERAKGGDISKKKKSKDTIGIMIAVGKVKKGKAQMAYGGSIGTKKYNYAAGGSVKNNLKPVPQGNKGKGLSKLPTQVRNKMGFMRKGGMV
jgi:hypothetical protein